MYLAAQLCPTPCDPMNYSLSGFSVHGIFQARILEWIAISAPGDPPDPGIKPTFLVSPALAGGVLLLLHHLGNPYWAIDTHSVHKFSQL